jgi:hypothetical protein
MSGRPRSVIGKAGLLIVLLICMRAAHAVAATGDERALSVLWNVQRTKPDDHAAVLAACLSFKEAHPDGPLGAVADTLAGWHLLKLGRTDEAVKRLEALPRQTRDGVGRGAHALAAAWLTRIDMARVRQALQFYYNREIGYPPTLGELAAYPELPETMAFPAVDRWGLRWNYRLVGFRHLPGLLNQKYAIRAHKLGAGSSLEQALALPYGEQIRIRVIRLLSTVPDREVVEMEIMPPLLGNPDQAPGRERKRVTVGVNTWTEDVLLAYVGRQIILVCDRLHWKVLPKPSTRR